MFSCSPLLFSGATTSIWERSQTASDAKEAFTPRKTPRTHKEPVPLRLQSHREKNSATVCETTQKASDAIRGHNYGGLRGGDEGGEGGGGGSGMRNGYDKAVR